MRALAPEVTLVIFFVDHRLAFLALAALVVAAAIPLAFAWARILPEDRAPFEIEPPSYPTVELEPPPEPPRDAKRNPIAILWLILVSLSFAIQFPGFPRHTVLTWLNNVLPSLGPAWVFLGVEGLFVLLNGGATCYAVLRRNFLRVPLAAGGGLVLLLWLLGPFLRAALLATR
jgi:hypothetical protein